MTMSCSNLFWRRLVCPAMLVIVFTFACASARAQTPEESSAEPAATTPPYALFQSSTLTGLGDELFAGRVPVVTSTGTKYYDVTIEFDVDSKGNLTLASGYPKVALSPTLITANFQPGRYVGPSTVLSGDAIINVSGPGVTSGGATEWSAAAASGADPHTYPCSATWYVGPLTSNPLYPRLKKAGITSTAWYYGIIGSNGCSPESGYWEAGSLIGLSQNGNTLMIVTFTYAGNEDNNTPYDEITYTYSPK